MEYKYLGPINTFLSNNYVDGVRLRLAGRTMAALNPHFFWDGYGAVCWGLYQFLGLGFGRVKQFVYAAKRTERAVKLSSFLSVAVQGKCTESLLSNCRVQPILCKDSANRMQ